MNIKPVFGVNTQAVFTPDRYNVTEQIMAFAVTNECWTQVRGTGAHSSIRVAGPLDKVELVLEKFKQFEMSCFDGLCDQSFCDPTECNYLASAPAQVPMINHSRIPL